MNLTLTWVNAFINKLFIIVILLEYDPHKHWQYFNNVDLYVDISGWDASQFRKLFVN